MQSNSRANKEVRISAGQNKMTRSRDSKQQSLCSGQRNYQVLQKLIAHRSLFIRLRCSRLNQLTIASVLSARVGGVRRRLFEKENETAATSVTVYMQKKQSWHDFDKQAEKHSAAVNAHEKIAPLPKANDFRSLVNSLGCADFSSHLHKRISTALIRLTSALYLHFIHFHR